jgi:ATP-dependent Clp protease ATP-binding subunit ClpC
MIMRVQRQLEGQGLGLELTQEAKLLLADKGYDPTLGARPLRRAIQRQIEDPISERMLMKEFRAGEIIVVDVELDPETNENMIVFRSVEGFTPPAMEMVDAGGSAAPTPAAPSES